MEQEDFVLTVSGSQCRGGRSRGATQSALPGRAKWKPRKKRGAQPKALAAHAAQRQVSRALQPTTPGQVVKADVAVVKIKKTKATGSSSSSEATPEEKSQLYVVLEKAGALQWKPVLDDAGKQNKRRKKLERKARGQAK